MKDLLNRKKTVAAYSKSRQAPFFGKVLLILASCFVSHLQAEEPPPLPRPESEPAYTQEQAEVWLAEVMPSLESVSGRAFNQAPVIECVSRDKVSEVLAKEFLATLNRMDPSGAESLNPMIAESYAQIFAARLLGKYSLADGKLLLLPGNLKSIAELADFPEESYDGLVKILIAHELTHALQEQEIGLEEKLSTINDKDSIVAFNAAIEGHAIIFHEMTGKELGLDESVQQLNYLLPGGGLFSEKILQTAGQQDSSKIYQKIVYDYGAAYMRKIYDEGGTEATWAAIEAAPVALNEILSARAVSHHGKTFIERMEGIENLFADGEWDVKTLGLDKAALKRQYDYLEAEDKAMMLANIHSASSRIAMQKRDGMPAAVIISVFTITDPTFAPALAEYMNEQVNQKLSQFADSGLKFERRMLKFPLNDNISMAETCLTISSPNGKVSMQQCFALMHRDKIAIQIGLIGLPSPSKQQYHSVAKRLFEQSTQ